jgi:ribosomal protein S18 acetylase RimI-like enzyme
MMVATGSQGGGVGRSLLEACIAEARHAKGLEMLTLSVTESNSGAVRLYDKAGFVRYGSLPHAIRVEGRYYTKLQMVLTL